MRIGIFSDVYTPNINGVVTSIDMLKNALEKQGHQVYIVTVSPKGQKYSYENKILRIPGVPVGIYDYRMTSIYPLEAVKTIKSWHLDLIHCQTEFGIGSFARILAKQWTIPIVYTYHTVYEDMVHYVTKGHFLKPSKKIVEYLTKFCCDKAVTELIVPTKKTYDLLKYKYKIQRDMYIIPTGIETDRFSPKHFNKTKIGNKRKQLGLQKEDIAFLFVGRLGKEKNVSFLIQNHAAIVKQNPHCKLIIVGDGPYRNKLEDLTKKLKLEQFITFVGRIPLQEIPLYYVSCDIFTTASTSETQGLTVIEAQSAGLPVLAIDDESFQDAIQDGITGYFFHTKKQYITYALELAGNKEKLLFMKKETQKWVEQFSSTVFAQRVLEVYKNALKKLPKPKNWFQKIWYIIKQNN